MTAPIWRETEPLLLASKSAIRRQLLEDAGLPVEAAPAEVDERAIEAEHAGPAAALAAHLAAAKAREASRRHPGRLCLGADQVLTLGEETLHKARSREEAAGKLARLQGREHRLTSAFALFQDGALLESGEDAARLSMRPLDRQQIAVYLDAAGEAALSSVGAYQLEKLGVHLMQRIEGDHTTILGLPMLPLLASLRRLGALGL